MLVLFFCVDLNWLFVKLKKTPTKVFDNAKGQETGAYVFNRNTPARIVMSVEDYENILLNH